MYVFESCLGSCGTLRMQKPAGGNESPELGREVFIQAQAPVQSLLSDYR